MKRKKNVTLDDILAVVSSIKDAIRDDRRESDEKFRLMRQESEEKYERMRQESNKEYERSRKEAEEKHRNVMEEYKKDIREYNKQLADQGFVQGEVAEDLFRRNITQLLADSGFKVDKVLTNIKGFNDREYDIVAYNGSEMFVFEIKNKLKEKDIDKFISEQVPAFKQAFPDYRDYRVYGGMGSLVVKKEVEISVKKKGLFLLTQGENGNANISLPVHLNTY